MLDEFPHEVTIFKYQEKQSDGGGGYLPAKWVESHRFNGFLDTPESNEIYQAEQLNHPFNRYLYYPYGENLTIANRVKCEGEIYELASNPMDQGGQHEVMKVALRLVE